MDNRPIGIFDSGLGGLTCIPYLMDKLPNERIIYFGDTARTPYGSKAISTIRGFAVQIADFLVKHNAKMIVIACNTVSATCIDILQEKYPNIPIVGIIKPAANKVANTCGENNKIGVIGTKVTIESHTYKEIINQLNENLDVFERACPAFVPLIEEGIIKNDIMDLTIKYYMDDFILENRLDTLVLGCTHYPIIRDNITKEYPELRIINPSEEIVEEIKNILDEKGLNAEIPVCENRFYASDLSENFTAMIHRIFHNEKVMVKFKNLDIDSI